ncbi:hypothetical protein EDD11_002598 [Mortierella claussenii]|nr:hypothetical protein EDD11_002598 [Mortierella claussenii]
MSRTGTARKSKDSAARTTAVPPREAVPATTMNMHTPLVSSHSNSSNMHLNRPATEHSQDHGQSPDQNQEQDDDSEGREHADAKRLRLASAILFVCILSFVLQTELTKFVQTSMGYQKPYFILYISHSFWAIALPAQFIYSTYISRATPRMLPSLQERIIYFARMIRQSTGDLYHRRADYTIVGRAATPTEDSIVSSSTPSSSSQPSIAAVYTSREKLALSRHLFWVTFGMTVLYMVPSYLWYTCVAMTSMANLTAIYNTACFFAYLFSILLLKERIVLNKVVAVLLSLLGVVVISLTMKASVIPEEDGVSYVKEHTPISFVGNILALIGAALYGFEEVVYKKYASPKLKPVMFANTLTGLMGVVTCTMLWVPIPILHWTGHEIFELPTLSEFSTVLMIATLGLIYNGCFMIVVSQTSPVFAAVGVMATIPLVALTDWVLFNETVGWGNVVGGLSILVGFAILVRENRNEPTFLNH